MGESRHVEVARCWHRLDLISRRLLQEQSRDASSSTLIHAIRCFQTARLGRKLSRDGHVLHMGTREFPVAKGRLQRQFLLIDSTFSSWMKDRLAPLVSPQMLLELERREQRRFESATHVFCMGRYVKQAVEQTYGIPSDRVTAVGCGLGGISPYVGSKDYRQLRVLFVAKSKFQKKGGDLIVEGARVAREMGLDVQLTLVGQPRYPESYQECSWITLHGRLPAGSSILQRLLEESALFAMPSFCEAFGIAWLEALACRTPVLGLNRNAFPEICGEGRFGFIPRTESPEGIAHALLEAFADPDRLERMGREGQAHVLEHYSWEKCVTRMLSVMDQYS